MIEDTILRHFEKNVDDYDTVGDKVVMRNGELHEALVAALEMPASKKIRILDLGCGTGHGMRLVLEKFPNAHVTGVDYSRRMIRSASNNLKEFGGRFELVREDFRELSIAEKFDAVISAVAIHNVAHEEKESLFAKIFGVLAEGGVFVNGDFFEAETQSENEELRQAYREFLQSNLSGGELDAWLHHAFVQDKPMKLSRQFQLLEKIGFGECQTTWQYCNEAVYVARKKTASAKS